MWGAAGRHWQANTGLEGEWRRPLRLTSAAVVQLGAHYAIGRGAVHAEKPLKSGIHKALRHHAATEAGQPVQ